MATEQTITDRSLIDEIVREVLARLVKGDEHAKSAASAKTLANGQAKPKPAAKSGAEDQALLLAERLITTATLAGRLDGKQRVELLRGAVLTPAARDVLKQRKITISHSTRTVTGPKASLAIGVAETKYDPAALVRELESQVSSLERLANTGLTGVVSELSDAAAKGGRLAVLFTNEPEVAVVLANRQSGVRAVAASGSSVARAIAAVGANFLILDPVGKSVFELRQSLASFVDPKLRSGVGRWVTSL